VTQRLSKDRESPIARRERQSFVLLECKSKKILAGRPKKSKGPGKLREELEDLKDYGRHVWVRVSGPRMFPTSRGFHVKAPSSTKSPLMANGKIKNGKTRKVKSDNFQRRAGPTKQSSYLEMTVGGQRKAKTPA